MPRLLLLLLLLLLVCASWSIGVLADAAGVENGVRSAGGARVARESGDARDASDCARQCESSIDVSEWDRILRVYGRGTGVTLNTTAPYNSMPAPKCISCAMSSGWGATCECTFQSTHGLETGGAVHVRYKLNMSTRRIVDVRTESAPPVRCAQLARVRAPPPALRTAFPFPEFNRASTAQTSPLDFVAAAAAVSGENDATRSLLNTLAQQQNARRLDVVASMGPVAVRKAGVVHELTLPACPDVPCTGATGMLQVHASDVDICAAYVYNYRRPAGESPRVTEEFLQRVATEAARPATRVCSVDAMTAPDSLGMSNERRGQVARARDVCGKELVPSATARAMIDGMDVMTWIFTDACGASTTVRHHVRIVDDMPPQISLVNPSRGGGDDDDENLVVLPCSTRDARTVAALQRLYPQVDAQWTGVLHMKEPCGRVSDVRVTAGPVVSAEDAGIVYMTWTATDAAGNNANVSQRHRLADQQRRVTTDTRVCVWPPPVQNYAHVHLYAVSDLRAIAEALLTPSTCAKDAPVARLTAHVHSCEYDGADARVVEAIRVGRLKVRDMCYYDAATDLLYVWPIRDIDMVGYKVTIEFRDYKNRPGQPYVYTDARGNVGDATAAHHVIHVRVPSRITADTTAACKDSASPGTLHIKTIPLDEMRIASPSAPASSRVALKVGLPVARVHQYARQLGLSPADAE